MSVDPKVNTFMLPNPICVSPQTGIRTAIELLNRAKQGHAVVVTPDGQPVGIVSARNLLAHYSRSVVVRAQRNDKGDAAHSINASGRVSDMMKSVFSCVPPSARLRSLRGMLAQFDDQAAVVVDGDNSVCGLLTTAELVKAFALVIDGESNLAREEVRAHNRALMHENEQLERSRMEDPMLRIGNRRAMMRDMHSLHARAMRYGSRYAVLLVDVDHFRAYNDKNGHIMGDQVLLQVVECLQTLVRECDRVYRFGGEEFLVALPETDNQGARATADRILTKMATFAIPHASSPEGLVTLSMGICAVEEASNVLEWQSVLDTADQALYAAKCAGRNQAFVMPVETAPARWCG